MFTQNKKENAVYAFYKNQKDWFKGMRRSLLMESIRATDKTIVSTVGQNDLVVEYWPANNPKTRFIQEGDMLEVSVSRAQRLYNDKIWPNPIVIKLENVEFVK